MESLNPEDFGVKEITSEERFIGDEKKYDSEEKYLYVHVVKAKGLGLARTRYRDPYVEITLGQVTKTSEICRDISNPEWNRVFAFIEDEIRASDLKVSVQQVSHHGTLKLIGHCLVDLDEIPKSVPSNCTLAPRWYKLQNDNNEWIEKELLLAVFSGYQADEDWNLLALRNRGADAFPDIRSQLYLTPKLWYLRVNVIGAYDLIPVSRDPQFYFIASLGDQSLPSRLSRSRNPEWNEDMLFVASEPFEEPLIITVQDMVLSTPTRYPEVGRCVIPLKEFQKRSDDKAVNVIWHNLETGNTQVASRIKMQVCLEGGYHVHHESGNRCGDLRPTDSKLWKPKIGVLELGILKATSLIPMETRDCRQTTDAYCVSKYGKQWFRTKTIEDSCAPVWNEVFRWDVFDPYSVVTVGVFDESSHVDEAVARDSRLGKVRIRLSTLCTGRVYTLSYPLLVIKPGGVQKMGEIDLAVRFTCSSWLKMMRTYSQPLLPKMHYICPINLPNSESLRLRAANIVSMHLARFEPPLKKDVVDYILDLESHSWSIRRSRVNYSRIGNTLIWCGNVIDGIIKWKSTPKSLLVFFCILVFILLPEMMISFLPLIIFLIGLISYFWSSELLPHIDMNLSQATSTSEFDLDEETDTIPSSRPSHIISLRYDRLRIIAAATQTTLGHVSGFVERVSLLFSWRDRRATGLFLFFCFITSGVLVPLWVLSRYMYSQYMYQLPLFKVFQVIATLYLMRPPRFRKLGLLSWVFNFFWRLPARHDDLY